MIKIFALLNLAGLLLFNMFMGVDIGVTQDMPTTIQPGSEVRVNVTVNKDKISGFAKLQIDLPEGLSATAIDTKGASFTFAEGHAKFIWMALPTDASFKVSYTLSAASNASGTVPVTGRLSFIQDNERKTVDMAPTTITIGNGGMGTVAAKAAEAAPVPTTAPVEAATTSQNAQGSSEIQQAVAATVPTQSPIEVRANRTITSVNDTEAFVVVTVDKGALRGFGKLEETLPTGFTAVMKENDDAIFTSSGNLAKFVWLNLPSAPQLKVSYRLLANDRPDGQYSVTGDFNYLMNDQTQRATAGTTTFHAGTALKAVAQNTSPLVEPKPAKDAPVKVAPVKEAPAKTAKPNSADQTMTAQAAKTSPATSVPAPEKGITYKVQIMAAHREVGQPYFTAHYKYDGGFSIERNEGWIKYVTGSFAAYHQARDKREAYITAQYNFPGPFVTAYNDGERITVQEALMIAKHQPAQ